MSKTAKSTTTEKPQPAANTKRTKKSVEVTVSESQVVIGNPTSDARATGEKSVAERLVEAMERRKKGLPAAEVKKPGRRGRKPKNIEYNPQNASEDDSYGSEVEYENIEHATGIRVGKKGYEEGLFSLDRFEDYDEELNFDW